MFRMAEQSPPAWPGELVSISFGAEVPTRFGVFRAAAYQSQAGTNEHVALMMGDLRGRRNILTRLHSACLTGDALGSLRCDCGPQFDKALERIAGEGAGVIIYNPSHEGRGIGLNDKLAAYALQDRGLDTVDANLALGQQPDSRDYTVEAAILWDLGIASIKLLTNNPAKVDGLLALGIAVLERVPLSGGVNRHNRVYLEAKAMKLGHWPEVIS